MKSKNSKSSSRKIWAALQKALKKSGAMRGSPLADILAFGWREGDTGPLSLVVSRAEGESCSEITKSLTRFLKKNNLGKIEVSSQPCRMQAPLFLLSGGCGDLLAGLPHRHYGDRLRPGSGIVRVVDGQEKGPSGTLTCFLSSVDGNEIYFLTTSHVLTNYWDYGEKTKKKGKMECGQGDSVYRNTRGYPSAVRPRSLGTVTSSSCPPFCPTKVQNWVTPDLDAGLVKVRNEFFEIVQRTTCYGSFGELADNPLDPYPGQIVTKCGAEEPHGGVARVVCILASPIKVHGPSVDRGGRDHEYCFDRQVLLSTNPPASSCKGKSNQGQRRKHPVCLCGAAHCTRHHLPSVDSPHDHRFAAPGDSGTMIVDYETKAPVGMLIAGSVLTGYYVMTPIKTLKKYWETKGLIFRRG